MKIKTKPLPYDEVMRLPRPAHQQPQRPNPLLRAVARIAGAGDLKSAHFSYTTWRSRG